MNRLFSYLYVFLAVLVVGAGCESKETRVVVPQQSSAFINAALKTEEPAPREPAIDADAFLDANAKQLIDRRAVAAPTSTVTCQPWRAGMVNHHVMAADLQWNFFADVRRCLPTVKRIIILSPDHFQASRAPIVTTRRAYRSNGIIVPIDEPSIEPLLKATQSAYVDSVPFEREHGIGALIPFLVASRGSTSTMSDVSILPILVDPKIASTPALALTRWLELQMQEGTLIVISSDMSHYLKKDAALANDRKTEQALASSDQPFFWRASDDFTDSGRTIWMLLEAFSLNKAVWRETAHRISTDYGAKPDNTTSYITGFWR